MKKEWWSKQHAIGLAIGILTTLISIPLVAFIIQNYEGNFNVWREIRFMSSTQSRLISLASIPNLIWFHLFLKKQQFSFGYGIIYAIVLNLFVVIALKFI